MRRLLDALPKDMSASDVLMFRCTLLAFIAVFIVDVVGSAAIAHILHYVFFSRAKKIDSQMKALQKLKAEHAKISAIEEFAKWARLKRDISAKQKDFDSLCKCCLVLISFE